MNYQIFKTECKGTEKLFIGVLGTTLSLLFLSIPHSNTSLPITILIYATFISIFLLLFYTAYIDFKSMEIDNGISLALMVFLLFMNLYIHYFIDSKLGIAVSDRFSFVPYDNFIFALLLGILFLLIVLITKEKALGGGDIRIAIIVGLLIGSKNSIPWMYITIFSALLYGLIIGYKKGSFKKLKIPFAPFMILGALASLLVDMYF